ncbi:MAG: hypothetical protein F6K54_05570 [Okeania sp. SIO3B5]|uniref:hypothetical protein n=1 Tax=Okeania sp. SIO3B5 TaxID=2607811 RepID=UPI0013FE771D|nr:hypothetical protein [Okeania sp. SIO3B5]NEO52588.1 hypothetical protein [Okeania sp. SIO3B5]
MMSIYDKHNLELSEIDQKVKNVGRNLNFDNLDFNNLDSRQDFDFNHADLGTDYGLNNTTGHQAEPPQRTDTKYFGAGVPTAIARYLYLSIAGVGLASGTIIAATSTVVLAPPILILGALAGIKCMASCERLTTKVESQLLTQEQELAIQLQEVTAQKAEYEEKLAILSAGFEEKLAALETEYQGKYTALMEKEEQLQNELLQAISDENKSVNDRISEAQEFLQKQLDLQTEQTAQEIKQLQEQHTYELNLKDEAIAQLRELLAESNACKTPPKSSKRIHHAALQVQEILLEHEVAADWVDSWAHPKSQFDSHWFHLRYGIAKYKVQRAIENIPGKVEGYYTAQLTWEDGKFQIDCSLFDPSVTKPQKVKGIEIEPAPKDWILNSLGEISSQEHGGYHLFVCGPTGSGKSSFLCNLLDFAFRKIGVIDLRIIDPKYPDTEWRIKDEKVIPQYKGFKPWTNPDGIEEPCALDGLLDMQESVENRLEEAREAEYLGKEKPERHTILWVIDETERLIAENPKNAKNKGPNAVDPILQTLKVGRSTRNIMIMLGQSPMCSRYGMLETDLDNFGIAAWLGAENIKKGIDEVSNNILSTKKRLRKQLEAWEALAEQDSSNKYIGLIKMRGQPAFIAKLPPPNCFSDPELKGEQIENQIPLESPMGQKAPSFSVSVPSVESIDKLADDARRLDHVQELRENNPNIGIEQLVATVYADWNVLTKEGKKSARKWRKAREHLSDIAGSIFPDCRLKSK